MTTVLSPCGRYRYTLEREWQPELGQAHPDRAVLFVMLEHAA